MQTRKLGFAKFEEGDAALFEALEAVLPLIEIDMTLFYRSLALLDVRSGQSDLTGILADSLYEPEALAGDVHVAWNGWLQNYASRVRQDNRDERARQTQMNAVNPLYVLRNYLAQIAIDAAEQGDFSRIQKQLDVLRQPYTPQERCDEFAEKRPDWARTRVGCSMLSCSS